nr:hypothetical protein [Tanacetum cinerariifolium]
MVYKSKRTWCGSLTRTWCPFDDGHGVEVVDEAVIETSHRIDVEEHNGVKDLEGHGVKVLKKQMCFVMY